MIWERVALRPLTDSPIESVEVMTRKDKVVYWVLIGLWLVANVLFWTWWLQTEHVVTMAGMAINSLLIAYDLLMPGWFFFFLGRMRKPDPNLKPPSGLKVAMVTTMVPGSEPWYMAEKTLEGMLTQEGYPHDVWLLDEGNDPVVRERCERLGIHHFSRKGINKYQSEVWPFKARTKAGNYNAWLDAIGYNNYDILVQMDTDHVPQEGYLVEMLRPFASPRVAYVAAPSVCNGNHKESWAVKGRAELEITLHGALQCGYNSGFAPIIIGSHAAFRLSSLQAIGGFQHTLAEDHHNTLTFAEKGYQGVFAPDAIAIGNGAESFPGAMVQEYQWARALVQILLNFFPRQCRRLSIKLFIQFLFAETWYPLFSSTLLLGYSLPLLALWLHLPWVNVSYLEFIFRHSLITLSCLITVYWVWRRAWVRPSNIFFVSWRSALFQLTRWPWVLAGCLEAFLGFLLRKNFNFRVTPKGKGGPKPLSLRFLLPYILFILLSIGGIFLWGEEAKQARGYLYLALFNSTIYGVALLAIVGLHVKETNGAKLLQAIRLYWQPAVLSMVTATLLFITIISYGHQAVAAALWVPPEREKPILTAWVGPQTVSVEEPFSLSQFREGLKPPTATPTQIPTPTSTPIPPTPTPIPPTPTSIPPTPTPIPTPLPVISLPEEGVVLGAYDPARVLLAVPQIGIEHEFVSWEYIEGLGETIAQIRSRGHLPLLTIEPYPFDVDGLTRQTLFGDISDGRYDKTIINLAHIISSQAPQPILVRWGHEMEMTGLYPWSQEDRDGYIFAYRHVVDLFREEEVDNVLWVWSPAGNPGCDKFYPGDTYTDFVGITILSDEGWDKFWGFDHTRIFTELLNEKYYLAEKFGKPIIIAEAGVSGTTEHQQEWLSGTFASFEDYPQLWAFVYFNDPNRPNPVTDTYPDWRISAEILKQALLPKLDQTTE